MAHRNRELQRRSLGRERGVLPMCFQLSAFEVALGIYLYGIYCAERLKFVLVRSLGLVWGVGEVERGRVSWKEKGGLPGHPE